MTKISAITKAAAADGSVSTSELRQIVSVVMADGSVDKPEFQAFSALLNAVSGNPDNSTALPIVAKTIASNYFLEDAATPGVFSASELKEFEGLIAGDGKIDALEQSVLDFLKAVSIQPGEILIRDIMDGDLNAAIAAIIADGHIDDLEAKSLYFRVVMDGDIDDAELAALVSVHQQVKSASPLWNQIFPVLLARAVVIDNDSDTFDISADEAEVLKGLAANGLDAVEVSAIEAILELANTDESGFGDWFSNQKAA